LTLTSQYPSRAEKDARDAKEAERKANGGWYSTEILERRNDRFEEYYRVCRTRSGSNIGKVAEQRQMQNILSEDELKEMLAKLKEDLPTTFRVTGSRA
jgi:hypothetical protein